jgi:hypothetical protein
MGIKPVETAIAAQNAPGLAAGLRAWEGAIDHVVLRAITARDTVEENLVLVRAAKAA